MRTHLPKIAALVFVELCGLACAQEAAPAPVVPNIREAAPGQYEIGLVHLDQKAQTLTFPGALNLDQGLMEYLIVTPQGSTHESLLVTDVPPTDVQFAMLLLGVKGSAALERAGLDAPPPQIDSKYLKTAPHLKGDSVAIRVAWKVGKDEKTAPVEDWLINEKTKKTAERGPWIYNGSMFNNGHFLAQVEGAIAALVTNPAALINNPRKGSDDDQIWSVNEKAVPPVKTPVQITIQLSLPPANPASPAPKQP